MTPLFRCIINYQVNPPVDLFTNEQFEPRSGLGRLETINGR